MTGRTCRIAQTGLQGQSALGGPSFSCLWLVLWSKAKAKIQTTKNSCKKQRKHPLFAWKAGVLWSCWADSNCRPHPYQFYTSYFPLVLLVPSYRLKPLQHKGLCRFPVVSSCLFPSAPCCGFLVPVAVLLRFLQGTPTSGPRCIGPHNAQMPLRPPHGHRGISTLDRLSQGVSHHRARLVHLARVQVHTSARVPCAVQVPRHGIV